MANVSLIRSVAAGSIAAGVAVLMWFNRLPKREQDDAEEVAREYGSRLIGKARKRLADTAPAESSRLSH